MCETVKRLASRIRKNSAQSALQWGHFIPNSEDPGTAFHPKQ